MELADMQDLGSCAARRRGSSPLIRIRKFQFFTLNNRLYLLYILIDNRCYLFCRETIIIHRYNYLCLCRSLSNRNPLFLDALTQITHNAHILPLLHFK